MSKKQFWIRLSLYILLGAIIPVAFLIWRFELFHKVSDIKLSGWGLITIIFIVIFFSKLIKTAKKGLPYSQTVQIFNAISSVFLPLFLVTMCLSMMEGLMKQLFQFVLVLAICETAASMINPIPIWAYQNNIELQTKSLKDLFSAIINKEEK